MKKVILLYIAFAFGFSSMGLATKINGYTFKPFKGKTVNLIQYTDYLTKDYQILASTEIDTSGKFNFDVSIKETQQAIIQIGYLIGIIYLDPDQTYTIYFPPNSEDGTYKLTRNNVNIVFKTIPKNDINGLILEFDRYYDQFLVDNRFNVGLKVFHSKLDTFKLKMKGIFNDIKNPYFLKYIRYSIADLELVAPSAYQKVNMLHVYNSYIVNRKIQVDHHAQMRFLMNFYEKSLKNQIGKVGQQVHTALTTEPSFIGLDTALNKDYFFKMKKVRELVIIDNVFTLFYDEHYDPNSMLDILYEIKEKSNDREIKQLADNVINKLIRMQPGTQAFPFELVDKNGEKVSLSSFKGKYVYINFWAIWSRESQAEMILFKKIKEEYGDFVEFVSINIDSKVSKFNNYIASHPQYNWNMLYFGGDANLLDKYEVYNVPHYVFIDPQGKIISAPAKRPSPNGDYESIDKTFFEIKKKLAKKKRFNVGIK